MHFLIPLFLSLGAMLCWGVLYFFTTHLTRKSGPYISLFLLQLLGIPFLLVLLPFIHQPISILGVLSFVALGIFDTCVWLLFLYATKVGNLSIMVSISRASILVTVALSVLFLHESFTIWKIISIITTLIGIIFLSINFSSKKKTKETTLFKGVPLILLEAVGAGTYMFLVGPLVRDYGWYNSSLLIRVAITITVLGIIFFQKKQIKINEVPWVYAFGAAIFDVIGFSLYNIAVAKYEVSYVSIIASSSSLVTVVLSYLFLKEKLNRYQLFGFLLTIIGIVLLQIA